MCCRAVSSVSPSRSGLRLSSLMPPTAQLCGRIAGTGWPATYLRSRPRWRKGSRWRWAAWAVQQQSRRRRYARHAAAHRKASRSEEHTSELQSLMRISYAVFCLKKKKQKNKKKNDTNKTEKLQKKENKEESINT